MSESELCPVLGLVGGIGAGKSRVSAALERRHDRPELGKMLSEVLALPAVRWVGVMGSVRHAPPHVPALRELGVDEADIKRVHRPIGLNIGSKTPAEIALATLAGLIADRNHRPGGFTW